MNNYPKQRYTGQKPWIDKKWLHNEYVIKNKSTQQIADEWGCKQNTIQCWLLKHNIKKEIDHHRYKQYMDKDYLYNVFCVLNKNLEEIAKENNVSVASIQYYMKKTGIEFRKRAYKKINAEQEKKIIEMYLEKKLSSTQIAKEFNTKHRTVLRVLRKNNIKRRNLSDSVRNYQNKKPIPEVLPSSEELFDMHWNKNISCKDIGKMFDVSAKTVRRYMNELGIPTKNYSESKKGLMVGNKHPNWKGGVTELGKLLRTYFKVNLVPSIYKRDNWICQDCGKKDNKHSFHVHHIIPFSKIVNDIIKEHPELNIENVEDKQKMYDIITKDARFLDLNNLILLCPQCHKKRHFKAKKVFDFLT